MQRKINYKSIPGWGIDCDPRDNPTYPLTEGHDNSKGISWDRPVLQKMDVEILQTNERGEMPAVFGTTVPPTGLSGMIRRIAFRYSEDKLRHWMPLLLADRIQMIEGLFQDLFRGHIPNFYKEYGLASEKKFNPKGFARKISLSLIVFSLVAILLIVAIM